MDLGRGGEDGGGCREGEVYYEVPRRRVSRILEHGVQVWHLPALGVSGLPCGQGPGEGSAAHLRSRREGYGGAHY